MTTCSTTFDEVMESMEAKDDGAMTSRQASAYFNNQGVDFLELGLFVEAIESFKKALHNLTLAQDKGGQQRLNVTMGVDYSTERNPSRCKFDRVCLFRDVESYIYCRGFRILQPPYPDETTSCFVQDTGVILFNLSLVHHLLYLTTTGNSDTQSLRKALSFYEMVQALLTAKENHTLITDPNMLLVLMACSNNMAQLHHSLGQYSDASLCMQVLSSVLTTWHNLVVNVPSLDHKDMRGFSLNIVLLVQPTLAAAA